MSQIEQLEPKDWEQFLEEFSTRNNNRRARFQVFQGGNSEEEKTELFFEEAILRNENQTKTIIVTRIDRSAVNAEKSHQKITDVIGVAVQYDVDGSEAALEITDKENELIMLRFESRVDGVS